MINQTIQVDAKGQIIFSITMDFNEISSKKKKVIIIEQIKISFDQPERQ